MKNIMIKLTRLTTVAMTALTFGTLAALPALANDGRDPTRTTVSGAAAADLYSQYQLNSLPAGSKFNLRCGNFGGGVHRHPHCDVKPEGQASIANDDAMDVRTLSIALALAGIEPMGGAEFQAADVVCSASTVAVGERNAAVCELSAINQDKQ